MPAAKKKRNLYIVFGVVIVLLLSAYVADHSNLVSSTLLPDRLYWLLFLLLGAFTMGAGFEPLIKERFPKASQEEVTEAPERLLKDYEPLAGYYPVACVTIIFGSLLVAALFLGAPTAILSLPSASSFWFAAVMSGVINIFIFYFGTKALRYGDLSLVSMTAGLAPLLTLPVSFVVYNVFGRTAPITDPSVTFLGFVGILLIVCGLVINVFAERRQGTPPLAPPHDWFARHPVISGMTSAALASVAINFDKVAVEAGNPFLFGIIVTLTVSLGTLGFVWFRSGCARIVYLFRTYARSFLIVGAVYGALVLLMALTLWGENVNYQGTIKRLSIVFATLYGAWVLGEGGTPRSKFIRIIVAIAAVLGIALITIWG